jgi:hypothetical protein
MKITTQKTKEFAPVRLTITFETQKELDAFGTLMNCTVIADTLEKMGGIKHASGVGLNYAVESLGGEVSKDISEAYSLIKHHPSMKYNG